MRTVVSKDIEEMRERLDALRVNISSLDAASMTHLSKLDLLSSNDQKKSEKIDKLSSSMNEIQDLSRRAFSMSQTLSEELKTEVGSWKEERTRMAPQVQRVVNLKVFRVQFFFFVFVSVIFMAVFLLRTRTIVLDAVCFLSLIVAAVVVVVVVFRIFPYS